MDNYDLVGDIPGVRPAGQISNRPGYLDVNEDESLLTRIRGFYDYGVGAFEENRRMHSEDLNFIYNAEAQGQWDPVVLMNRRGKPCYTFNRVIGPVNIIVADMRQTRPSGKVRPASSGAKQAVATIYEGLCRSIELASRADAIYKEQYKFAVAGGYGAWRVMPVWEADDGDGAFSQVLRLVTIPNPQTVVWDPECNEACAGDANRCIIAERIHEDMYQALYSGDDEMGVSLNFSRDSYGWYTDKEVRIAEYFERVPYEKMIALLTDDTVADYNDELKAREKHFEDSGLTAEKHGVVRIARDKNGQLRVRKTITWKVMWVKIDGTRILEGPYVYDWKRIPVVRCPGRYINIEGRKKLQSLVRHAKDAQRSYNSRCSDMIERSALVPKAPYLVTETMIKGYEQEWNQANVQSRPYLPYNIDPAASETGGMPFRTPPIDLPQGAMALAQLAQQDIQAATGYYDPALGNAEDMNRVSGKALVQHTRRSDLGSYEFTDGFQSALQLTWELFIDMIPTVMDSNRIERILGADGTEYEVELYKENGDQDLVNDLKKGRYDVTVTIGPNFETQRQETLQTLIDAAESIPLVAQYCPDLLVKNIDSPDAQEMARRCRIPLIQQGIIQPAEGETNPGPSPAQQQQQQMSQLEMQTAQAKLQKITADATTAQSKAGASHLEGLRLMYETAGKHLANLLTAKKIGEPGAAEQAESESESAAA